MLISDWSSDVCSSDLRVFGKEIVAGCCKLSPVQHEAVELLGRAADRRQAEAAAARGELLVEMGEEQPGQIADLLCDEEIVPHETLDARHAGPVGIAHAPGDFGLDVQGQPFPPPLCDAVQVEVGRASGRERVCPYG